MLFCCSQESNLVNLPTVCKDKSAKVFHVFSNQIVHYLLKTGLNTGFCSAWCWWLQLFLLPLSTAAAHFLARRFLQAKRMVSGKFTDAIWEFAGCSLCTRVPTLPSPSWSLTLCNSARRGYTEIWEKEIFVSQFLKIHPLLGALAGPATVYSVKLMLYFSCSPWLCCIRSALSLWVLDMSQALSGDKHL